MREVRRPHEAKGAAAAPQELNDDRLITSGRPGPWGGGVVVGRGGIPATGVGGTAMTLLR